MQGARAFIVAVCVAVVCSTSPPSLAQSGAGGTIIGQVQVVAQPGRRLATAGAYPGRTVGVQPERQTSELDNVVVFLATRIRLDTPPRHVTIRQTNEEFIPHVVAIPVGSTVEFPNDDLIFHNVFSLSSVATFDLGRYPRNASKARAFTKPGIVKVFCHLHSHMNAIVRVFPHGYFAVPDRSGRFTIRGVPAGRHQVTAWHERAGDVTLTTTVDNDGTTELTFALPVTDPE